MSIPWPPCGSVGLSYADPRAFDGAVAAAMRSQCPDGGGFSGVRGGGGGGVVAVAPGGRGEVAVTAATAAAAGPGGICGVAVAVVASGREGRPPSPHPSPPTPPRARPGWRSREGWRAGRAAGLCASPRSRPARRASRGSCSVDCEARGRGQGALLALPRRRRSASHGVARNGSGRNGKKRTRSVSVPPHAARSASSSASRS